MTHSHLKLPDRLAAFATCALAACTAPRPPSPSPPGVVVGLRHLPAPARGPVAESAAASPTDPIPSEVSPADTLLIRARIGYCSVIDRSLPAATQRAQLIFDSRGETPLTSAAELALGTRVASGVDALEFLEAVDDITTLIEERPIALPRGVTAALSLEGIIPVTIDAHSALRPRVELLLTRPIDPDRPITVSIEFDDVVASVRHEDSRSMPEHMRRTQVLALRDSIALGSGPLAISTPNRFEADPARRLLVVLEVEQDRLVNAHDAALEACVADLGKATSPPPPDDHAALSAALRNLRHRPSSCADLVYVAEVAGARIALELALIADDATLRDLSQRVLALDADASTWKAAPNWQLDRVALELLAAQGDLGDVAPECNALLFDHTGEVAGFGGALQGLLGRCADRAEFDDMVRRQNQQFLAMPDPGSRIRAFDWLRARGAAPEDYDPLADRASRREALRAAELLDFTPSTPSPAPENAR